MLSVLVKYLIAKLETFEYLDKVHGLSTIVQVGDETMPAVYSGNELVHVNFDSYDSLVYIQQNGKIGRETTEHPAVACKYNVVERYPLRLIVYSQGKENVNCESYSQQIADSIKSALNGKQQTLETAANLTNATIILGDTDLDKNSVWQTQFSSPNQLKDSDILIAIDLEFEIEGDDTCFANNPCENSEFVFDLSTQTFCERVDACLDIPTDDGQYVLDITGGVKSWSAYSPSGAVVIEKTKAEFLALVAGSDLVFPATYKITDVEAALFIETISANEFSTNADLLAYAPSYSPTGSYMGQWHTEIGAINNGEIYTWGEWNWQNTSGGSITPNVPDENTIDSGVGFTQMSKSTANHYTLNTYNATIDEALNLRVVQNYNNNNVDVYVASVSSGFTDGLIIAGISHPQTYANTKVITVNCVFADATEYTHGNTCFSGLAYIKRAYFTSQAGVRNCFFNNNSYTDNTIQRASGSLIIYNCDLGRNGCYIDNIITESTGAIDISSVRLDLQSYISGVTNSGTGRLNINDGIIQHQSSVTNLTYSGSGGYGWSGFLLHEVAFSNYTATTNDDLTNQIFRIEKTDFAGLSDSNLDNLNIVGSKGWFTITHNFTTSPLTSGSSLLYNIIPTGARLTGITSSGTLTGTNIALGLESDDEGLISGAVGLLPLSWNSISNAATANRSLKITASGGNITAGELTVKVEFVI